MRERKNVYELPAGDTTLEWYSKAVVEMKSRPTTDPTSWNYQGAMHGFQANLPIWQGAAPLPSESEQRSYWNRCQHGSWYFLPWHRMYLAYFEQIVAQTIVDLGGPADWSLPFWNYSDTTNPDARTIPPAFTDPANSTNGLWISERNSDTIPANYVTLGALGVFPYTGDGITSELGFGGPRTAFSHSGRTHGRLEHLPHDMVHVAIGGAMGDPRTAALDPIFWLHHANIDRLWQVWLNQGNRANPGIAAWLNFGFNFHDKDGNVQMLTCIEVEDTTNLLSGYEYQGVPSSVPETGMLADIEPPNEMPLEVVAASNVAQPLSSKKTRLGLGLQPPRNKRMKFMAAEEFSPVPESTFLHFENITGTGVPPAYDVYLNVPDDDGGKEAHYAGSLAFFGVEEASTPSDHHSGSGQHYALDVSELMSQLRTLPNWKEEQLDVHLEPNSPPAEDASVVVGRISLYSA